MRPGAQAAFVFIVLGLGCWLVALGGVGAATDQCMKGAKAEVSTANGDVTIRTSLLDARPVAGDAGLVADFATRVRAACTEAVLGALALGYRHIDTATMYGNEAAVGAALAQTDVPRGEIHVTTKVWPDSLAPAAMRRSLAR